MMHLTLSPIRMDAPLTLSAEGATLICNGQPIDLASYDPETPSPWIVGQPELREGVWHVTLILPHGPDAPQETLFPEPILLEGDGPVPLPPYDAGEEDEA